jgi:uncharacterized RDD family membrane protein YckC
MLQLLPFMKLASRATRLLGQLLDALIAIGPFFVAMFMMEVAEDAAVYAGVAALLFGAWYYFFADSLPGGQSWGKLLLGIAVVDEDGQTPCSARQSFARNFAQPILGVLDWVFNFGKKRQRLGDMAAGTIVIERRYTDADLYRELDMP